MLKNFLIISIIFLLITGFSDKKPCSQSQKKCCSHSEKKCESVTIKSNAFQDGLKIPAKFTCDGENISPQLSWGELPKSTKSIALICDDPDAPMGTWVHWVMYNIPADQKELKENIPVDKKLKNGAMHGITSFKTYGYGGPCPPSGTHRYFFKIYALDIKLEAKPGLTKKELLAKMKGHILSEGKLMGKYTREQG